MAHQIRDALEQNKPGFHMGQRLILPFHCQILKIILEDTIYTEMVGSKHLKIHQDPQNTSIYFRKIGSFNNMVDSYKPIKLLAADWEADLCNPDNHVKLVCEIREKHRVSIEEADEDTLFI